MTEFYCERCKTIGEKISRKTTCGLKWNERNCGGTNLEIKIVKTFDEWNSKGYKIKKGSKSVGKNKECIPVFSDGQVYIPNPYNGYGNLADECLESNGGWEYWKDEHDATRW